MLFNDTIIMRLNECYEILGIKSDASLDEVKKAYRRKSLVHHPDRNNNSADSTNMFQKINEAYEIINKNRQNNADENIFGDGAMNLDTLMKMFADMGNNPSFSQHMNKQLQKPIPIIKRIEITLEQVYSGCMVPIEITRNIKQSGVVREETETLYVDVAKGVDTNEIIVFREKGHIVDDAPGGDIKVFVSVLDHAYFKRSGLDLIYTKCISLKDALCGVDFEFEHVSGKLYKINNTKGQTILYPGYKKIVPGLGLQRQEHIGNLLIEFEITFPEKLNADQIDTLKKIM